MGKSLPNRRVVTKGRGAEVELGRPEFVTSGSLHTWYLGEQLLRGQGYWRQENWRLRSGFHEGEARWLSGVSD